MRKCQQKQILELVNTLSEANTEIKRLLSRKESTSVIQLLADCQDCAIQIGNYIEQLEGKGAQTVSLFEEYCQFLYQASFEMNNTNTDIKFVKRLQRQIIKIENSVKDDLKPNKIEIAFLPYKASMWDSLESIWLAANDDPQCDAFVVAIPYYDRLPGGTFGQMHYEGNQYPDYVPIVDWRSYNLEECHPDVIFVHNPYDEGNYVTSVHPDYYNKKLKSITDLLCYVPYFVSVDDVASHFCVCAGTQYANKVFVQSERVRQTYIRAFKDFEKANNCRGRFGKAEDKFVALGSPKFDKVIHTKREDCQIPNEWRRLIEKPDGTQKKIFFYNTTVSSILRGNEDYIKKIRYVLDAFRSRDDIVLWWRPHPLNEATYQSMRSNLLAEYESIVAEYRLEGLGIYDDTADLHRAIAISDSYYGDWSSLVALYQCLGKPVMIQDVSIHQSQKYAGGLSMASLYDDGNFIWFAAAYFNALFKIDKQSWKVNAVGIIPNEISGVLLYTSIAECNGRLYFSAGTAKENAEYDIFTNTFRKIPFELIDIPLFYFYSTASYKDWVFFIPYNYSSILKYDTNTGETSYYSSWADQLNSLAKDKNKPYFKHVYTKDEKIFAPSPKANAIIIFNMENCESEIFEVGHQEYSYKDICYDGMDFWLLPVLDGPVIRWNYETKKWKQYDVNKALGDSFGKAGFCNICYADGYVWLFSREKLSVVKINVDTGEIIAASELPLGQKAPATGSEGFAFAQRIGDVIYAQQSIGGNLSSFDLNTGKSRTVQILAQEKDHPFVEKMRSLSFRKGPESFNSLIDYNYYESTQTTLNDYFNIIAEKCNMAQNSLEQEKKARLLSREYDLSGNAGYSIYNACKGLL